MILCEKCRGEIQNPDPAAITSMRDAAREMREALEDAAAHFWAIAEEAEHWRAVFQNSAPVLHESRWSQIRNHARHQASLCRAALVKAGGQ